MGRHNILVDQKTPSGYIPPSEREFESTSHTAQSMAGKNPQMEKLKAMREMAKAKSALSSGQPQPQTQQQSPKFTASEISSVTQIKKSPNSSNDGSPMEETGPKIPEVNIHSGNHRTGSASDKLDLNTERKNSVNGTNDRSSSGSVGGYGDSQRPSKISNYPEHLSTFRHDKSPQPTQSVSPTSQSTSSSSSSATRRHDSESSRKNHVSPNSSYLETPRKCRKMASQLLGID